MSSNGPSPTQEPIQAPTKENVKKKHRKHRKSHHSHGGHHHSKKNEPINEATQLPGDNNSTPTVFTSPNPVVPKPQELTLELTLVAEQPALSQIPILKQSLDAIIVNEGRNRLKESDDQPRPSLVRLTGFSSDDKSESTSLLDLVKTFIPGARLAASLIPTFLQRHQQAGHQLVNRLSTLGNADTEKNSPQTPKL